MATEKITVKLEDSQLPTELKISLAKSHGLTWDEIYTAALYRTTFTAIPTFLKNHESKENEKVAFKAVDFGGGFIMGAIASYHAPEEDAEEDAKGSWSLEFTTDESDLVDIKLVLDSMNNEFVQIYEQCLWDICGGRFKNNDLKQIVFISTMDTLINFMDKNCKDDGSEFELILDDYFIATTCMEKSGDKVLSIVPGSIAKQLIKNDAIL